MTDTPEDGNRVVVHYAPAEGETFREMQDNVRKHPLYSLGDAVLVWINESDFMFVAKEACDDDR